MREETKVEPVTIRMTDEEIEEIMQRKLNGLGFICNSELQTELANMKEIIKGDI